MWVANACAKTGGEGEMSGRRWDIKNENRLKGGEGRLAREDGV
jgi:hypothetical protein